MADHPAADEQRHRGAQVGTKKKNVALRPRRGTSPGQLAVCPYRFSLYAVWKGDPRSMAAATCRCVLAAVAPATTQIEYGCVVAHRRQIRDTVYDRLNETASATGMRVVRIVLSGSVYGSKEFVGGPAVLSGDRSGIVTAQ
jgi:hypothetical protein